MTKNIEVVDEQGNVYGATYPKRAKGLVKNGRARFVGENRICLACPPDMKSISEDNMDNNKSIQNVDNSKHDMSGKLTRREIFEEVQWITESLRDNSFMEKLDDSITSICSAEGVDSDAIRAMVESVCDVYKMRTSTLEKSLSLYQQMLYDISDDD